MTIQIEKFVTLAGVLFLVLLASSERLKGSELVNFDHPAFATVGATPVSIPVGHAEFCRIHDDECRTNARLVPAQVLTDARWNELLQVNSIVNTSIVPVTDQELYKTKEFWTYPRGYGDCEDYVLAKRRALIDRGWPPSTLLISVVRQENGEGHAVLMVRTDRGDLVLDNQDALIRVWNETPYRYIKRQSQADAGAWVDIFDDRSIIIASR